ncbi:MAG: hypothetical protein RBU45_18895 [Myxococcota bacterium]|nr:hypothetical protein [Myxococcota bacterium]
MSETSDRYNQVVSPGTILTRLLDRLHLAWVTRPARGDQVVDSVVTVSNVADTVIAARTGRLLLSVQVQGVASGIRVAAGITTTGGTLGEILNAAAGADQGGGYWSETLSAGAFALRAITAPVDVHVREIY